LPELRRQGRLVSTIDQEEKVKAAADRGQSGRIPCRAYVIASDMTL